MILAIAILGLIWLALSVFFGIKLGAFLVEDESQQPSAEIHQFPRMRDRPIDGSVRAGSKRSVLHQ